MRRHQGGRGADAGGGPRGGLLLFLASCASMGRGVRGHRERLEEKITDIFRFTYGTRADKLYSHERNIKGYHYAPIPK